ncbi:MAG: hypothetical protein ACLQMS_08540 [Desulfomonilaceae bacterium]
MRQRFNRGKLRAGMTVTTYQWEWGTARTRVCASIVFYMGLLCHFDLWGQFREIVDNSGAT